jgi:hypothetical protein
MIEAAFVLLVLCVGVGIGAFVMAALSMARDND